jgi:hypothetical protein
MKNLIRLHLVALLVGFICSTAKAGAPATQAKMLVDMCPHHIRVSFDLIKGDREYLNCMKRNLVPTLHPDVVFVGKLCAMSVDEKRDQALWSSEGNKIPAETRCLRRGWSELIRHDQGRPYKTSESLMDAQSLARLVDDICSNTFDVNGRSCFQSGALLILEKNPKLKEMRSKYRASSDFIEKLAGRLDESRPSLARPDEPEHEGSI